MSGLDAVIGLGNPGPEYSYTYHNIGFMAVDRLISTYRTQPVTTDHGELHSVNDDTVQYLGKPGQYVNNSGTAVSAWAKEYGWNPSNVFVVYDDFSLDVGKIRIRPSGSAGGHNGMADIINELGTSSVPRIRVGIGPVSPGGDPAEFVLSKITDGDRKIFRDILSRFPTLIETISEEGIENAMDQWNGVDFDE